jgi:hypothetical protein
MMKKILVREYHDARININLFLQAVKITIARRP